MPKKPQKQGGLGGEVYASCQANDGNAFAHRSPGSFDQVEIFVEVVQSGPPYPIEIVVPQFMAVAVALALVIYLWQIQEMFGWKR